MVVADDVSRAILVFERIAVADGLAGEAVDMGPLLSTEAAKSINPYELGVLTDEATVKAVSLKDDKNSVTLTGFLGADGAVDVVDAEIMLVVTGTTVNGAPFTITRTGHLTLIDQRGWWRIDSFDLRVQRDLP